MKIIIFLLILYPSISSADISGYLFLGKYLNHEQQDLENRKINYRAGIYLEIKTRYPTFFLQEETLIRDIEKDSSYPKQINYMLGIKQKIYDFELIMTHECLHPIDGVSNGKQAESYNLIEARYNF